MLAIVLFWASNFAITRFFSDYREAAELYVANNASEVLGICFALVIMLVPVLVFCGMRVAEDEDGQGEEEEIAGEAAAANRRRSIYPMFAGASSEAKAARPNLSLLSPPPQPPLPNVRRASTYPSVVGFTDGAQQRQQQQQPSPPMATPERVRPVQQFYVGSVSLRPAEFPTDPSVSAAADCSAGGRVFVLRHEDGPDASEVFFSAFDSAAAAEVASLVAASTMSANGGGGGGSDRRPRAEAAAAAEAAVSASTLAPAAPAEKRAKPLHKKKIKQDTTATKADKEKRPRAATKRARNGGLAAQDVSEMGVEEGTVAEPLAKKKKKKNAESHKKRGHLPTAADDQRPKFIPAGIAASSAHKTLAKELQSAPVKTPAKTLAKELQSAPVKTPAKTLAKELQSAHKTPAKTPAKELHKVIPDMPFATPAKRGAASAALSRIRAQSTTPAVAPDDVTRRKPKDTPGTAIRKRKLEETARASIPETEQQQQQQEPDAKKKKKEVTEATQLSGTAPSIDPAAAAEREKTLAAEGSDDMIGDVFSDYDYNSDTTDTEAHPKKPLA
jgi:hypothetical protein